MVLLVFGGVFDVHSWLERMIGETTLWGDV